MKITRPAMLNVLCLVLLNFFATVASTPALFGEIDLEKCQSTDFECDWYPNLREAKAFAQKTKDGHILRLTLENETTWQCTMPGSHYSSCSRLSYDLDSTGYTTMGLDVLLRCKSNPHCVWRHGNITLTDDNMPRHKLVHSDPAFNCSLMITNVQPNDSGQWYCDKTMKLTVIDKDGISTVSSPDVTAVDTTTAILPCRSENVKEPKGRTSSSRSTSFHHSSSSEKFESLCFWMHGDSTSVFSHRASDTPDYDIVYDSKLEQCDLIIYKVRKEHEGDWYCTRGSNPRQKVHLSVADRPDGHQPDVLSFVGSTAFLTCRLRASNKLCFWTHGHNVVLSGSSKNRIGYTIVSDPEKGLCNLLIEKVQEEDSGNWFCHNFGKYIPTKVELGVKTMPDCS